MARGLGTRVLATVLFTDIVGSTAIAEELDDRRWRELLRRHHAIVRRQLRRFRGREIDTAGDGFLAMFDSPAQAVRCACAVSEAVRDLGIEIRAGLHLGEVELTDGKAQGIAVHIGARILALAKPGDVLVSAPLRSTAAGSGVQFEARGRRRLKGVEGTWQLFAVAAVDGEPRTPALETQEAARRRAAISPTVAGRRPTILVVSLAAVAAAVLVGVLIAGGQAPPPPAATGPAVGSLVPIDPETNRVGQVIEGVMGLATNPTAGTPRLAAGEGSVWVLHGVTVSAVDPRRGGVWKQLQLGRGLDNKDVEVGYRTVWVLVQERLDRINPATGELLPGTTFPDLRSFVGELALGREGVWLGSGDALRRLDPHTGRAIHSIRVPGTIDTLGIGDGSVWVGDSLSGTVFRIDPRTRRVVSTIEVRRRIDHLVVGEGHVWILDSALGTLSSIRPDTEEVREPFRVGDDPAALTVGFGSVWVAGGEQGTVLRINPSTLAQEQIPVGGQVSGITVDEDERVVWVTIS